LQRRLQILGYLLSKNFRCRQICGIFEAVVFQPEDIQTYFIALHQFIVIEDFEALAFMLLVTIVCIEARDEIREIVVLQTICLQREMLIRSQVINPQLVCPWLFSANALVEEENVCLHSLRIEDSGRQSQERMHIALLQQSSP